MSAQPRWDRTEPASRPVEVRVSGARAESDENAARIVSVIAFASIAAGAINIAAAATIGRGSVQNIAFFGVVGAAQVLWGLVTLAWAPRWWLALGALGNAVVVATWVVSRTVGLPFGKYEGIVLPVRFPDSLAQILAAVTLVGAAALAVRIRSGPVRGSCSELRARGRGGDRRTGHRRRAVADQRVRVQRRRRWRPQRPDRALRWRQPGRNQSGQHRLRRLLTKRPPTCSERSPAALGRSGRAPRVSVVLGLTPRAGSVRLRTDRRRSRFGVLAGRSRPGPQSAHRPNVTTVRIRWSP